MTDADEQAREAARRLFAGAGRSNVGKSSLVNALTGRNALARVSQSPGRTRQINFFRLGEVCHLVDLPGYGYARISKQMAAEWQHLIFSYLKGRASLRRVALLIDARRGVMAVDQEVMRLLDQAAVSYVITLTKIDTLKASEREAAIAQVMGQIAGHTAAYPEVLVTSAETREGVEPLRRHLAALVAS